MKIAPIALLALVLILVAAFAFFSFAEIPVSQQPVVKKIENDQLFKP